MSPNFSRRTFLQTATASTAAVYAARVLPAWAATDRGTLAINTPLTTFSYSDVELFDGPMKRQFEENHARFLNLDDDRLLKVFRQVAGLPAPGEDMGGWYDLTGFSLEQNDFMVSSPAILLDNTFLAWPEPMQSLDRSQPKQRLIAWSRDMPRRSTPKPNSS